MTVKAQAELSTSSSYPSSVKDSGELEEAREVFEHLDPELVKRTWRKVDLYIMPLAVLLYLACYIDR